MKNKVKIASLLLAIAGLSGCEINDPVNDWADLGQQTAYVYWELKDAVNAGNDLDFRVYYYADGSPHCQSRRLPETNDGSMCPCCN